MKPLIPCRVTVGLIMICFAGAWAGDPQTSVPGPTAHPTDDHLASREPAVDSAVEEDDLGWLVGRWRCVTRQYLVKAQHLISYDAEDSLEYFNVYLPYADDHLTLKLTDQNLRPIAAEFLARFIDHTRSNFNETLQPMSPWGPVSIGSTLIRYGNPPIEDIEFRFRRERRGDWLWLVLESKLMRLELIKLPFPVGEIGASRVVAPIRDYSPERIQELKQRYEDLTKRLQGPSTPSASQSPKQGK